MRFLSFDCANKSLAYFDLTINTNRTKFNEIKQRYENCLQIFNLIDVNCNTASEQYKDIANDLVNIFNDMNDFANNLITVNKFGAVDILEGELVKNTSDVTKVTKLKQFLDKSFAPNDYDCVVVEHQAFLMNGFNRFNKQAFRNKETTLVQGAITMYWTGQVKLFCLINSKNKNKISFHPDLKHEHFIAICKTRYDANKTHSKKNIIYYDNLFNLGIKNKIGLTYLDDVGDAFLQIFAALKYPNLLIV